LDANDPDTQDPAIQSATPALQPSNLLSTAQPADIPGRLVNAEVQPGDTLTHVFKRVGASLGDMYELLASGPKTKQHLTRLTPGEQFAFQFDDDHALTTLHYRMSLTESYEFARAHETGQFKATHHLAELQSRPAYAAGTIRSSLYLAAQEAGLPEGLIMELANIFAWDIDFALDIRENDEFRVIYEELHHEGTKVREGAILAAEFRNRGQTFTAIRYTDSRGNTSYYTPDGDSMRKAFLRSPVEFARISSHFNLRRKHPILHTIRAHKGTDYAAPTGTPIRAAGDGRVVFRGIKGGYGKTVIIQHGERYRTLYAHLHRYSNTKQGAKIQQGQIIGYVGKTGLASGPHLHYEFYENGMVRNPVTVKLPHADPIAKGEKTRFMAHVAQMTKQFGVMAEHFEQEQVARAD
jgi:murein DD-endopeptidase MepM/ murein hydrolase activator NlpD